MSNHEPLPGEWHVVVEGPLAGAWLRYVRAVEMGVPGAPLVLLFEAGHVGDCEVAISLPAPWVRRLPPTWWARQRTRLVAWALRLWVRTFCRERAHDDGQLSQRGTLLAAEARDLRRENAMLRALVCGLQRRNMHLRSQAGVGGLN